MKTDKLFYRLFCEIFLYLRQYKPKNPWQAVVIFPNEKVDKGNMFHYGDLKPRLQKIYLINSLPETTADTSLNLLKMIISKNEQRVIDIARKLIEIEPDLAQQSLLYTFVETIILYRCPDLTRKEIETMIHFPKVNIKHTPLYQEALAEGIAEGIDQGEYKKSLQLTFKLLIHRFGKLKRAQESQIKSLSKQKLDNLIEALLDFKTSNDLAHWLELNKKTLN
jgi:predicted transposase YdaD